MSCFTLGQTDTLLLARTSIFSWILASSVKTSKRSRAASLPLMAWLMDELTKIDLLEAYLIQFSNLTTRVVTEEDELRVSWDYPPNWIGAFENQAWTVPFTSIEIIRACETWILQNFRKMTNYFYFYLAKLEVVGKVWSGTYLRQTHSCAFHKLC